MIVKSEANGQGDSPSTRPNDPLLAQQWALKAVNAAGGWKYEAFGQVLADMRTADCAPFARNQSALVHNMRWDVCEHANTAYVWASQGNVRVCMVDTGVDYYHPDLVPNLWNNPGENPVPDGIDNDGNGAVCLPIGNMPSG